MIVDLGAGTVPSWLGWPIRLDPGCVRVHAHDGQIIVGREVYDCIRSDSLLPYQVEALDAAADELVLKEKMRNSESAMIDAGGFANYTFDELVEAVVDLDRSFDAIDDPQENQQHAECSVWSDVNSTLGREAIFKNEPCVPYYVWVDLAAEIRFRFKPAEPEGYPYDSFDADIQRQFPSVYEHIDRELRETHGAGLSSLAEEVRNRLSDKPRLIIVMNEMINRGRKMKAAAALEAEGDTKDEFYAKSEDYGIF